MERVEVTTTVHLPPAEVFEFLIDFPGYASYSEYLKAVRQDGDGAAGTEYALEFAWWKLSYTARTAVVDVDPPERIDWVVTKDFDADGHWLVRPVSVPEAEAASEVRLRVDFDPDSVGAGALDLPPLVSLDRVVEKAKPLVRREATRVVERVVADVEGEPREVDLDVETE